MYPEIAPSFISELGRSVGPDRRMADSGGCRGQSGDLPGVDPVDLRLPHAEASHVECGFGNEGVTRPAPMHQASDGWGEQESVTPQRGGTNPWLSIPASDYEAHMRSPAVRQLQFLSDVFRRLLVTYRPSSIAVLGCATGNGFEHLRSCPAQRVVGIDINPRYLDALRDLYQGEVGGLELVCSDIASCELAPASVDLVSCALFLEYVDPAVVVEKASRWLTPAGVLAVVIQLPSAGRGMVTATPFASLKRLESIMRLVDPQEFRVLAERHGLRLASSRTVRLETGKEFLDAEYHLRQPPPAGDARAIGASRACR